MITITRYDAQSGVKLACVRVCGVFFFFSPSTTTAVRGEAGNLWSPCHRHTAGHVFIRDRKNPCRRTNSMVASTFGELQLSSFKVLEIIQIYAKLTLKRRLAYCARTTHLRHVPAVQEGCSLRQTVI